MSGNNDSTHTIASRLRSFVTQEFPLAARRPLQDADPLLESGILDSLGVLQLVTFIEEEFEVMLSDEDMVSEAFESIGALARFVETKLDGDTVPRA